MLNPTLNEVQIAALRALAVDPAPHVEPATLSKLRKLHLAEKKVSKRVLGHQKTTSPLTDAGRAVVGLPPARTPEQIAASLTATAQAYHEGTLTHAEMGKQNAADWTDANGREAEVRAILRETYDADDQGKPLHPIAGAY